MKRILSIIAIALLALSAGAQTKGAQTKGTQTKAEQPKRMAVTALSENMMRLKPDYESALETQSLMGTVVEIIGEEGYWRQVVTPEPYTAWCTNLGLVEMTQEEIDAYKAAPKYICTAYHSGVYSKPSLKSEHLSDLSMGNLLRVVFTEGKKVGPSVTKGKSNGQRSSCQTEGKDGHRPLTLSYSRSGRRNRNRQRERS